MTTISNAQLQSLWDRDSFAPKRGKTILAVNVAPQVSLWERDTYAGLPTPALQRVYNMVSLWDTTFAPRFWELPVVKKLTQKHLWECDTWGSLVSPLKVRFSPRRIVHTYTELPASIAPPKLKRSWGSQCTSDSDSDSE